MPAAADQDFSSWAVRRKCIRQILVYLPGISGWIRHCRPDEFREGIVLGERLAPHPYAFGRFGRAQNRQILSLLLDQNRLLLCYETVEDAVDVSSEFVIGDAS